MYTTPVTILAAQGAHKLITLYAVVFEYIFTTSAFAGGDSTFGPVIQYGNTNHAGGTIAQFSNMDITSLSASSIFYCTPWDGGGFGNINSNTNATQMINVGLFATNPTAAFTGGGGSMRITIYYSVFTTTI
jgi:hypothetical protein